MKTIRVQTRFLLLIALCAVQSAAVRAADDWTPLFDGRTLAGWKVSENPNSVKVQDGAIVCHGPRAHAFYVGDGKSADFKNFELKADVMTRPGANSGIYFHTKFQPNGWPAAGYEVQINNSQPAHGNYYEFRKTGSLYGVRNQYKSIAKDDRWFTLHVAVTGKRIRVSLDDVLLVDYTEPAGPDRRKQSVGRFLSSGTVALQCHDPGSKVLFKNIRIKRLADDVSADAEQPAVDDRYRQIARLHGSGFPLIDLHVHLKGGLTLEEAMAISRKVGINYGIAPNCGIGFPITDDRGIYKFLEGVKGQPVFVGMQAEGREWVKTFSKEAIAKFDYVFTDAMTFTDDRGKRIRLWIKEEVDIDDEQAFMEMYVERILSVLNDEPIDVYVNPTFLPACIAESYDRLWTEERMDRVVKAAANSGVAIEINSRLRLPSPAFIKKLKQAGVKFTFGTNNMDKNLGQLEYCLDMIQQCRLTPKDMFVPGRRAKSH